MTWGEYAAPRFNLGEMNLAFLDQREPLPTGVGALDSELGGGWQPGVNVLMAAPGAGKSALALFSAMQVCMRGGNAAFLSLEMTAFDCWARLCSARSCYEGMDAFAWSEVPRLAKTDAGRARFVAASSSLAKAAPGLVVSEPASREASLVADEVLAAAEAGASLVCVDYLQYVEVAGLQPGYETVTAASHAIAAAAKAANIPVVLVCSMSREGARRSEPDMHSGSGSGAIEYDATTVTTMWRDAEDLDDRGQPRLKLKIQKNRRGKVSVDPFTLDMWPAYNFFR